MSKPPIKVNLYPNPNDGNFRLSIFAEKAVPVNLVLFDMQGKILDKKDVNLVQGRNNIPYLLNQLPDGTYLIGITCEGIKGSQRFIIQR